MQATGQQKQNSYFWEEAPFIRLLLPFITGILLYDRTALSPIIIIIITGICFISYAIIIFQKAFTPKFSTALFPLGCIILCGLGWLTYFSTDIKQHQNWYGYELNKTKGYLVSITDAPKAKPKTYQLKVSIKKGIQENGITTVAGNALVYVHRDAAISIYHKGDEFIMPNKLAPITNSGEVYGFDYKTFCARNGIYHQGFLMPDEVKVFHHAKREDSNIISITHTLCNTQLERYFTDRSTLGLIEAMLVGDEQNFDPALRASYSQTGIIHIVAISGSHVAGLFGVLSLFMFWLRGKKGQILKYIICLAAIWFYVLMAGAPPSAIRSAVMFSVLAGGLLLARDTNPLNTLFASTFILLFAEPAWLFSVGFQLSVAAVLGLILFYKPLSVLLYSRYKIVNAASKLVAGSIAAELLAGPIVVYYFHNFPIMFALSNIIAAFFVGVLAMFGGIMVVVFSWFPFFAHLIAGGLEFIMVWFNHFIVMLQNLNPKSFNYLQISGLEFWFIYITIAGFAIFFMKKKMFWLMCGMVSSCLLLVSLCVHEFKHLKQNEYVIIKTASKRNLIQIQGKYYSSSNSVDTEDYSLHSVLIYYQAWKPMNR